MAESQYYMVHICIRVGAHTYSDIFTLVRPAGMGLPNNAELRGALEKTPEYIQLRMPPDGYWLFDVTRLSKAAFDEITATRQGGCLGDPNCRVYGWTL